MRKKKLQPQHEIDHGVLLSRGDTEAIWGWGTPAGRWRAWRRASLIANEAQLIPGKQVLEIGCGTGMFTEMFARSGSSIVAVDISAHLLEKAYARQLPVERVRFIEGRFEDCNVDGPFDAIIGSSVLHHLDLESAIIKIYEMLKPGGIMSFAEPNLLNPQVFLMFNFRQYFPYISPDENAFTSWHIKRLLFRVGFIKINITPFDWLHPSTPDPLIGVVKALGECIEKIPFFRNFSGSLLITALKPEIQ